MKDMKQRIIALTLVVVMALLSLVSCGGSFSFADEDLSAYADFDYDAFMDALQKLKIEDGDYTTDPEIRKQKELNKIYDEIVAAIVKNSFESDRKTEGKVEEGDVLYFIYYAVDEKTGNVYYTSEMRETSITATNTKDKHVINLGNVSEDNEFLTKIKENLADVNLEDTYKVLTAADIKAAAEAAAKEEKADATADELKEAVNKALKVQHGQTVVISYERTFESKNDKDETVKTTEVANYVTVTLDSETTDPLLAKFFEEKAVALVGDTLSVYDAENDKNVTSFDITIDDVKYTYSKVKVLWVVENEGTPIATFKYTPYDSTQKVTPDNLASDKEDLKDVELTYYVYPAYALTAPAPTEITALDLLVNLYGKNLVKTSFEIFEDDEYKNGDKKISELVDEIKKIYNTKDTGYYAEGTELKKLYDATVANSKDTEAAEALTKAQNAKAKEIFEKICEAKKGDDTAAAAIVEEKRESVGHTLKEAYDSEIVKKVQTEIWELINESVKIKDYPQEVVEEFYEILYESYENDYYTGAYNSSISNYKKYDTLNAFLMAKLEVKSANEIEGALIKEAKEYIDPILKIFVVAQACAKNGAGEKVKQYINDDIADGLYDDDESIESAREESQIFLVGDDYMKYYKKTVGRVNYRQMIEDNGETNLRTAIQFNKLFYYLAGANLVMNEEDGDHAHAEYEYVTIDGVQYISFKTVKYTIVEPTEDEETTEGEGETEADGEGDLENEN